LFLSLGLERLCVAVKQAFKNNDSIEINISDTGHGISEEDIPFIFDRFYRSSHTRELYPNIHGSGLGLSFVKWLIEAHKGSISISSVVNEGTTFTVTLPL